MRVGKVLPQGSENQAGLGQPERMATGCVFL
nr:MAG TPA_asm: hypothetical protein [Caudoviricetes sp.]